MLTRIEFSNYRSFLHAEADLSPFTLVIGANGSGKTNFLRFFRDISSWNGQFRPQDGSHPGNAGQLMPHFDHQDELTLFRIERGDLPPIEFTERNGMSGGSPFPGRLLQIFRIDPHIVAAPESIGVDNPIASNGGGVAALLDALKTGAHEDIFDRIESDLRVFLPDVEKLSLAPEGPGKKSIQLTNEGVKTPIPGKYASDGTRVLISLLAIIHQPSPPPLLLIEDIDHSLHPRLFEDFIGLIRGVAAEREIQIIATTHNPYLLDCFQEESDAVLLVEKKDGASTVSSLGPKVRELKANGGGALGLSTLYLSGFLE